jgi:nucleoside-diphosphate-sugar epimerase
MSDTVLVTGAGGFVGHHVVENLRREGIQVFAAKYKNLSGQDMYLNVQDPKSICQVFGRIQPTHVIHCAAYGVNYGKQNVDAALEINLHGSLRVLECAANYKIERLIHLGSCSEYGSRGGHIPEDAPLNPTAIYASTKAATTILMRERANALCVRLIVARPFGIWGPREPSHRLVPQIVNACLERVPLKLTPCDIIRDYSYVEDMAEYICRLTFATGVESGAVVNLGSGRAIVLRDFVLDVARELGGEALMRFGELPYRPTEMASQVADVSRMRSIIGEPRSTSLHDGLMRMVSAQGGQA